MRDELNRKLEAARGRVIEAERVERLLAAAQKTLDEERERRRRLAEIVEKEGRDVGRLEGLSLTGLFVAVLGDKEKQLEKERQELLAAKLRLDECEAQIQALEREVAALQGRADALGDVEAEAARALEAKEQALASGGGRPAELLVKLAEEAALARARCREVREAIEAAGFALDSLGRVEEMLGSARNWGIWDLVGGGIISTAIKHRKIDEANRAAQDAQQHLSQLARELADLDESFGEEFDMVEVSGFLSFADHFFDDLVSAWMVQGKLSRSQESVERVSRSLRQLFRRLRMSLASAEEDSFQSGLLDVPLYTRPREFRGILNTSIPYAKRIEMMGVERAPVGHFAPRSKSDKAYKRLWQEVRDKVLDERHFF